MRIHFRSNVIIHDSILAILMNLKHVFVIAATLLMFSMATVKPETLSLTDDRVSKSAPTSICVWLNRGI